MMPYALKFLWREGTEEAFLRDDTKARLVTSFATRAEAVARRRQLLESCGHLVLGIDVVPYPKAASWEAPHVD